ncbi:MAG: hypothetical protein K2G23_07940 [Muribaculaceae bacterium]|nr:hypothetical protein [Muribaculaceae bacterium]
MESLRLSFEANILGERKNLIVEVPYSNGLVATSEFCPTEYLSGSVELMAAVRGETLDKFMADCRHQLIAMEKITEADTPLDAHIGGLMAAVMDRLSRKGSITFAELLSYADCFSLLLKGSGFDSEEIREIYPRLIRTIIELYPENIEDVVKKNFLQIDTLLDRNI